MLFLDIIGATLRPKPQAGQHFVELRRLPSGYEKWFQPNAFDHVASKSTHANTKL